MVKAKCFKCGHSWDHDESMTRYITCPDCGQRVRKVEAERGYVDDEKSKEKDEGIEESEDFTKT